LNTKPKKLKKPSKLKTVKFL